MANATLSLPTSVLSWLAWCSLSAPSLWPPFLIAHWLLLLEVPRTGSIASLPSGTHFYNLVFLFLLFSFLFLAPQMGCFLWFIPHYDQLPEDSTTPAVFFHINSSTYITGVTSVFLKTPYLLESAGCSPGPQMAHFTNLFFFESLFPSSFSLLRSFSSRSQTWNPV